MNVVSRFKPYTLLLFAIVLILSCKEEDDTKIVKMRIQHYSPACNGIESSPCPQLLVQEGNAIGTESWTIIPAAISGFEFELGYSQDLIVRKKKADQSKSFPAGDRIAWPTYTLIETVSKTKVTDETFQLFLFPDLIAADGDSNFSINYGAIEIECESLCDEFTDKRESGEGFMAVFKHVDINTIRLVELK